MTIIDDDLLDNPTNRVPVTLCLDVSGSMNNKELDSFGIETSRISELNKGIAMFFEAIKADEIACASADIAIVTFNSNVDVVMDFRRLEDIKEPPTLTANGQTDLGGGVLKAIELLYFVR